MLTVGDNELDNEVTVAEGGTCVGRTGPERLVVTGLPKSWEFREFAGYSEIQEHLSRDRHESHRWTCLVTRLSVILR